METYQIDKINSGEKVDKKVNYNLIKKEDVFFNKNRRKLAISVNKYTYKLKKWTRFQEAVIFIDSALNCFTVFIYIYIKRFIDICFGTQEKSYNINVI